MALEPRNFKVSGQWAANASTTIPPIPVSGQAYRNAAMTEADANAGQGYDVIYESARNNQKDFEATGIALQSSKYGWPIWTPLEDYVIGSQQTGIDGIPYIAIQASGPNSGGAQDPTTTTGYWLTLSAWVDAEGGGLPPGGNPGDQLIKDDNNNPSWVPGKITPTAAQNFYVRTDGNDNNSGVENTPGGAFQTIQGAINAIQIRQNTSPFLVTINIANGTYNENIRITSSIISTDRVIFIGESTAGVIVTSSGNTNTWICTGSGNTHIQNITLRKDFTSSTIPTSVILVQLSAYCVIISSNIITIGSYITYSSYIFVWNTGICTLLNTTTFSGPVDRAFYLDNGTLNQGSGGNSTISNINFNSTTIGTATMYAVNKSTFFRVTGTINVVSTTSAKRYLGELFTSINTNGSGPNYFPGTTAGTTANYAIYT